MDAMGVAMCDRVYCEHMCEECRDAALEFVTTEHGDQLAIRLNEAVNRRD